MIKAFTRKGNDMKDNKTLVEQIRNMVNESHKKNTFPEESGKQIVGHEAITRDDVRMLYRTIADRIEREYMELPILEGEPLKVGDKVDGYSQEGAEVVAVTNSEMVVVRSTVKERHGYHDEAYPLLLWDVRDVKRHRQEVLDADGVPIKVGDHVWWRDDREFVVTAVNRGVNTEAVEPMHGRCSSHVNFDPKEFTHKQPDTLERIEEDAFMDSIIYCDKYGLLDSRCNAEEGDGAVRHCTDCGLSCETRMVKHLLRRQREVLERGKHD